MIKLQNTLSRDVIIQIVIVFIGTCVFIPFIGNVHLFDWDEINFAECAREMVISKNYLDVQLYFQPFWEKPPLFIWLQALSMNLFGINEFSARFPNAMCGIFTLLILYNTGKQLQDEKFGFIWAFTFIASILPHFFFKSGIIDPWFNLLIYVSIYYLILHTNNPVGLNGFKTTGLAGFFLGLALLCKGPVALLIVGLTVCIFCVVKRFKKITSIKFILFFAFVFGLVGFSWFLIALLKGNAYVIQDFIDYQIRLFKTKDSDHGGPFIYHFVVLFLGCFPSSLFFIFSITKPEQTNFQKHIKLWLKILFWVVLILFSIVQTKIVHYSSLCYFPLTYIAANYINKLIKGELTFSNFLYKALIVFTILFGVIFIIAGLLQFILPIIPSYLINDAFIKIVIQNTVNWVGIEWLIGLCFLTLSIVSLYRIKKKNIRYIYLYLTVCTITIYSVIHTFSNKIEMYSQNELITFCKVFKKFNAPIVTLNFKSYSYLFYGNLSKDIMSNPSLEEFKKTYNLEHNNDNTNFIETYNSWVCNKNTNILAFIILKTNHKFDFTNTNIKLLCKKNGFEFYIKTPTP